MQWTARIRLVVALFLVVSGLLGLGQFAQHLTTGFIVVSDDMSFVDPTPDNDSTYNTPDLVINVSTQHLSNLTLEWGGANASMMQSGNYWYAGRNATGNFSYRIYALDNGSWVASPRRVVRHGWLNVTVITLNTREDTAIRAGLFKHITAHTAKSKLSYKVSTTKPSCTISDYNLSCTPPPNESGKYEVTLTLRDGPVKLVKDLTLNISPVDDKPFLRKALPNLTIPEHKHTKLDLSDYFGEVDGEALSYSTKNTSSLHAKLDKDELWIYPRGIGLSGLNLTVTDNVSNVSFRLRVNVTENRPPKAHGAITMVNWTENNIGSVRFSQLFSDPDGDALTFNASDVRNMSISVSSVSAYFVPDVGFTGARDVVLRASDGQYEIAKSLKLIVRPLGSTESITPPQPKPKTHKVTFAPLVWKEDTEQVLTLQPTVPLDELDPATLSVSVSGLRNISPRVDGAVVRFRPDGDFFGEETAQVTVKDKRRTYKGSVKLHVQNTPDPIRSKELPKLTIHENKSAVEVDLADYFIDPDREDLQFDVQAEGVNVSFKSKSLVIFSKGSAEGNVSARIIARSSSGRELASDMIVTLVDAVQHDGQWSRIALQSLIIFLLISIIGVGTYRLASARQAGHRRSTYIRKTIDEVYEDPELRRTLKAQATRHPRTKPVTIRVREFAQSSLVSFLTWWQGLTGHADPRLLPKGFRNEVLYIKETISSLRAIISSTDDHLIKAALAAEKKRLLRAYHGLQGQPELDRDGMRKLLLYVMESASALQEVAAVCDDPLITSEVRKQARRMRKVMDSVSYRLEDTYRK